MRFLPGGDHRCVQQPKSVPIAGKDVQLPVMSWSEGTWHLAAQAGLHSKEELELLEASGSKARLASWAGMSTWRWQGRVLA